MSDDQGFITSLIKILKRGSGRYRHKILSVANRKTPQESVPRNSYLSNEGDIILSAQSKIMGSLIRRVKIKDNNFKDFEQKLTHYYTASGCTLISKEDHIIKYGHAFSIMDPWRFNPFNRFYQMVIKTTGEEGVASFTVEKSGQLDPIAEEVFWNRFVDNFINFYFYGIDFVQPNQMALEEIKKSNRTYLKWAFGGFFLGAVLSLLIYLFTGSKFLSLIAIPICLAMVLNYRNKSSRARYLSQTGAS